MICSSFKNLNFHKTVSMAIKPTTTTTAQRQTLQDRDVMLKKSFF